MTTVLGDDGPDGRHVPDLVAKWLRVVAVQRLVAVAAGRGLTLLHVVRPVVELALGLGMSVLATGLFGRGRLGRWAFECGWVGRGWFGGVGGVLVDPGFEFGEALLVVLDQGQDSGWSSRWDLLPEFVRDWRARAHAAGLAIKLLLGKLDL